MIILMWIYWCITSDMLQAKIALQKVNKIVSLATAPHDGSIFLSKANTEEFLEYFEPDSEPPPSTIDTWARGVGMRNKPNNFTLFTWKLIIISSVNTKKIAVEDTGYSRSVPKAPNSAPSVSSFRSSVTGRSRGINYIVLFIYVCMYKCVV